MKSGIVGSVILIAILAGLYFVSEGDSKPQRQQTSAPTEDFKPFKIN